MSRPNVIDELDDIYYPETDGEPMAENTLQYDWIVTIKGNLDKYLEDFVAGDLFWYPVKGNPKIVYAPDIMVALGRPKGYRPSYKQWLENNIAPQVIFEILSPGNREEEMKRKFQFYEKYGVQEYYVLDAESETQCSLAAWIRANDKLIPVLAKNNWTSPLLNIRFESVERNLIIYGPDNLPFLSFSEIVEQEKLATQRAEAATQRAEAEHQRAEAEHQRAEAANQQLKMLLEKLKSMGIDPGSLT